MTKNIQILFIAACLSIFSAKVVVAQKPAPVDPMSKGSWLVNFGFGPGTPVFGNGTGFGPAAKVAFETGMWELGPGVLTLGGEAGFSFFAHRFGEDWRETWVNMMFGARSAYHYGWGVRGLDNYAGIPLGIGFCANTYDDRPGHGNAFPVYPYFGIFFGASYFFAPNIGVNAEVGYNSTYANIGLVFRVQ
ncbi:MAG: hypothetical protein M0Q38_00985 [Bacteroidales bacterium]|jgi:hypothetical protein|nr:hypothetical protein [Bacteroidales bacterium]